MYETGRGTYYISPIPDRNQLLLLYQSSADRGGVEITVPGTRMFNTHIHRGPEPEWSASAENSYGAPDKMLRKRMDEFTRGFNSTGFEVIERSPIDPGSVDDPEMVAYLRRAATNRAKSVHEQGSSHTFLSDLPLVMLYDAGALWAKCSAQTTAEGRYNEEEILKKLDTRGDGPIDVGCFVPLPQQSLGQPALKWLGYPDEFLDAAEEGVQLLFEKHLRPAPLAAMQPIINRICASIHSDAPVAFLLNWFMVLNDFLSPGHEEETLLDYLSNQDNLEHVSEMVNSLEFTLHDQTAALGRVLGDSQSLLSRLLLDFVRLGEPGAISQQKMRALVDFSAGRGEEFGYGCQDVYQCLNYPRLPHG